MVDFALFADLFGEVYLLVSFKDGALCFYKVARMDKLELIKQVEVNEEIFKTDMLHFPSSILLLIHCINGRVLSLTIEHLS